MDKHANFSLKKRSWAEAGPVTRGDGRSREGGSEWWRSQSKNSTASFYPTALPFACPLCNPSISFLHPFITSLLNEKDCRWMEGRIEVLPSSFHGERRARCWRRRREQRGRKEMEGWRGNGKGCVCLLTNSSSLTSRLNANSCFLFTWCWKL